MKSKTDLGRHASARIMKSVKLPVWLCFSEAELLEKCRSMPGVMCGHRYQTTLHQHVWPPQSEKTLNCQLCLTSPSLWPKSTTDTSSIYVCVCSRSTPRDSAISCFISSFCVLSVPPLVSELSPRAIEKFRKPVGCTFFNTHMCAHSQTNTHTNTYTH